MSICKLNEVPSDRERGETEEGNPKVAIGAVDRFLLSEESLAEDSEDDCAYSWLGKKRSSSAEVGESSKRIKVEEGTMTDGAGDRMLKIERDLERNRRNEPFKRRDLKTIVEELDMINSKLKEAYSKYVFPNRWGVLASKNCSEKWNSRYIPQKLFERYQMLLGGNSECQGEAGAGDVENDKEAVAITSEEDFDDVLEAAETVDYESLERSYEQSNEELNEFYSDSYDGSRTRGKNKDYIEEWVSNECHSKGNSKRNYYKGKRNQKPVPNESNKLVTELKMCPESSSSYEKEDNFDSNKAIENLKIDEPGCSTSSSTITKTSYEDNPDMPTTSMSEKVECPVCDKEFEKSVIESHAMRCAEMKFAN